MRVAAALASLALVACGSSPPAAHTAHDATHGAASPLPFHRVTLDPTGATIDLPGDGPLTTGLDAAPGRPATLNVEQSVVADGVRFTASVHDFVAHEIPDPAALAGQFLQAAAAQFQVSPVRADTTTMQGAFAADATFESTAGVRLRMFVVVGRTRAYHPFVIGPRAAMDARSADVERFLHSLTFAAEDVPWQPGDGVLRDGGAWATVHPVGWRFSVDMPGPAAGALVTSSLEGAESISITLTSPDSMRGFRVTGWHFTGGPPRDVIAKIEHDITTRLQGTIREDRPALVQGTGARALSVELPGGLSARELVVMLGDMVYEVVGWVPANATPAMRADVDRFLASFHVSG